MINTSKFNYIRAVLGQLGYLIFESFRGLKQHRTVVLPSLVTIFLCSVLLAGSLTSFGGVVKLLSAEKALYTVEAFLPKTVSADSIKAISENLLHTKRVESVEYVSADSALADFRRHFSGEMLDLVEGNPLPPFFRVKLKEEAHNPVDLMEARTELFRKGYFEEVQAPIEWAERIAKWKFKMVFWPLCLSVLLLATLSLIICNSVRLSLFSRQLLVENMKYTGGSPFFIEFPFVLEGLILGLVGSGLAVTLLAVLVNAIGNAIPVVANNRSGLGLMLAGVVALVTVLSAYFSYRTVRRFLTVKNFEQE